LHPNLPKILINKSCKDQDFDHIQGTLLLLGKENELRKCSKLVEGYYKKILDICKVKTTCFLSNVQFPSPPPFFFALLSSNFIIVVWQKLMELLLPQNNQT
jgi:hypothetical protein